MLLFPYYNISRFGAPVEQIDTRSAVFYYVFNPFLIISLWLSNPGLLY